MARLFVVVDVWDALRYDRSYRAGWSAERVKEHLREGAGRHFDPQVVPAFLRILERDGEPFFPEWPNGR
jgi:HD-GYP domain-containing protein (c-di-GMP phosphodiesterase class II)